jgi:hypothetical protein
MGGMNPRMNPPPRGMGPMGGSYGPGMRGPNNMGPSGGPIPPMIGQRPWTPNTSTPMSYSSSSPGSYGVNKIKQYFYTKTFY